MSETPWPARIRPSRRGLNYDPRQDRLGQRGRQQGRLVGVFTDGDLRRRLAAHEDLLQRALKTVMTRNPITIRDDALAVDALRIFNDRNIDDLIVVNARKEPVGLVDSQDLPKLKLM